MSSSLARAIGRERTNGRRGAHGRDEPCGPHGTTTLGRQRYQRV